MDWWKEQVIAWPEEDKTVCDLAAVRFIRLIASINEEIQIRSQILQQSDSAQISLDSFY